MTVKHLSELGWRMDKLTMRESPAITENNISIIVDQMDALLERQNAIIEVLSKMNLLQIEE